MKEERVIASAPGKLMLFGEYGVIHHQPCLVTAVDTRVKVLIEMIDGENIFIETPRTRERGNPKSITIDDLIFDRVQDEQTKFILASIQKIFSSFKVKQGLRIITIGPDQSYGLGSSSAVTVACNFALLKLFNIPFDEQLLFDLSYQSVLKVQKNGSGFDVASAVYGGSLFYQINKKPRSLMTVKLPVVIGYTGKKVSTIHLMEDVERKRVKNPEDFDLIFKTMGKIANAARIALLHNDWERCGELANINQGLLSALGVNTEILQKPILAAREAGALGAKLSGAGGGDCMFAFVDEKSRQKVENAIENSGAHVLKFETGSEGVRLETQFG